MKFKKNLRFLKFIAFILTLFGGILILISGINSSMTLISGIFMLIGSFLIIKEKIISIQEIGSLVWWNNSIGSLLCLFFSLVLIFYYQYYQGLILGPILSIIGGIIDQIYIDKSKFQRVKFY
jgi:F420-0:gamma-glutamyl ligase-like protein